jgi:hypothetical protein
MENALIFYIYGCAELVLPNAPHAVLVHSVLPTTHDEIVVTGAAVDPEPDNAGVFQPVDDLYHAALPMTTWRNGHRSRVNYWCISGDPVFSLL